ncbi:MAG: hypothetical protein U0V18_06345 [Anaerolineales bacterium]
MVSKIIDRFKTKPLKSISIFSVTTIFTIGIILLNGISLVPPEHYQKLSLNPFTTRTDISEENYWQENILLPVVAYYLKLNSRIVFNIFCLSIFFFSCLLFTWCSYKQRPPNVALISALILITSPTTTIILSWLGTPDSLTLAFTIPFLFTNSSSLFFLLTLLGTTNHIMFLIIAVEILTLRSISKKRLKISYFLASVAGGIIGYFIVKIFISTNNIQILVSRFDFIISKDIDLWINLNTKNFLISLFSLFNVQWVIILISVFIFFKVDKTYYSFLILALLVNYGITFFTEDTTRVFSILSWGLLTECIFHSYEIILAQDNKADQVRYLNLLYVVVFLSLLFPRYYSWNGGIYVAPSTNEFYEWLLKSLAQP